MCCTFAVLNTVHGSAWLAMFTRGGLSPFNGSPEGDSLNPAYFQRLDRMIQYANDQGHHGRLVHRRLSG